MSDSAVVAQELRKTYTRAGSTFHAVDGISFEFPSSGVYGLLGPNGAGKSTTLEMIAGLRKPDGGSIRVLGLDPFTDRGAITRRVSIQPQKAALFQHQTVLELLQTWAAFYPDARKADEVVETLDLGQSAHTRVAKLSGGQTQRLLIGASIISSPDVLILDEPSAGLDPNARDDLWRVIRSEGARGATVILSTHSMEEAEALCEFLVIVNEGTIVASGTPHGLISEYVTGSEIYFDISRTRFGELQEHSEVMETATSIAGTDSGSRTAVIVETSHSDRFLERLMGSPLAGDVQNLKMGSAGLDSVFRKVAGRELDDEGRVSDR